MRRHGRHGSFTPDPRFTRLFPRISGNAVNGLGEHTPRRPSPFFWHPVDRHAFGALQEAVIAHHRRSPDIAREYSAAASRGPKPIAKATDRVERTPGEWSDVIKEFVLANEGDLAGITPTKAEYVYEGYDIPHPSLIMIGVAMDYAELNRVPSSFGNPRSAVEVARQYNRASRVSRTLANFILAQGFDAEPYPGPFAKSLNMIPAAIAAGLGGLGKHGSMINRTYGSSFRLSAVGTNMPVVYDQPDDCGSEDFCASCQVCVDACPPSAIADGKQMVRGTEKWYVDFDKCIPYFGEALGCAICLAVCPWSRPGTAPKLAERMLKRRARKVVNEAGGNE
jgi:epoxyqueuosine reductase